MTANGPLGKDSDTFTPKRKKLDSTEPEDEGSDLAALYDNNFHEEVLRDPHKSQPWYDHVQLLKTLRPSKPEAQLYRISEISKIEKVAHTTKLDSPSPPVNIDRLDGDLEVNHEDSQWMTESDSLHSPSPLATSKTSNSSYHRITTRIINTYEQALSHIPLSYKLWYHYLKDLIEEISQDFFHSPQTYKSINEIFERALVHLYGYPAIYLLYAQFLQFQNRITRVRQIYNKAIANLAITQHKLIWEEFVKFVLRVDLLPLGNLVLRRYIQIEPRGREVLYEFLKRHGRWDEAAVVLCKVLAAGGGYGKWLELCDLIRDNASEITSIPIEHIIREGIKKYTDQVAKLWVVLASIYILRGQMYIARDIYEESLKSVTTVQDFTALFDAYAHFLENFAKTRLRTSGQTTEVLVTLERLENLIKNRAILLATVRLKQNINNVYNWIHYAQLSGPEKMPQVYSEAVQSVDPKRSVGRVTELWLRFAAYYEEREIEQLRHQPGKSETINTDGVFERETEVESQSGQSEIILPNTDRVFERAVNAEFKYVDDLVTIWCAWVEVYLRHKNFKRALELTRRAVDVRNKKDQNYVQQRLHKSVKLWCLCLDMEENFGTLETCRSTFDLMLKLKVVTPQLALNFTAYLEEHKYFEASFSIFEKCIALFKWPHLYFLYLPYLTKFIKRYRGTKLERAREIFQSCLANDKSEVANDSEKAIVPPEHAKYLYYLYASLEEEFGLIRHCLEILGEAVRRVEQKEQLQMIKLYLAKTAEFYGIVKTRPIYQECLEFVKDEVARELCKMYVAMERGLGEIDRARAIYVYVAQISPVEECQEVWRDWREFEILHGNEDSFKDMLRMKSSVQAQFSNTHFNTEEIALANEPTS